MCCCSRCTDSLATTRFRPRQDSRSARCVPGFIAADGNWNHHLRKLVWSQNTAPPIVARHETRIMNKQTNTESCESYELLISCAMDDEITAEESRLLEEHLAACASCRAQQKKFENVNQAVFSLGQSESEILPCLLYTSPSPRDRTRSRMPSSA